ncbi:AbiV family abortive infection protein [Crocinitomix catalasitica]|uniref:AbiV family abortive infection protein n=1 Tax=Crocinitomix catalasitica TaxID=184607 RepID=UPI0012F8F7EA|nr:AbiV family abortive infection protein [Crocinitomix catalasitica]
MSTTNLGITFFLYLKLIVHIEYKLLGQYLLAMDKKIEFKKGALNANKSNKLKLAMSALNNSGDLLESSTILYSNQKYGTSMSLSILAMEECSKAIILLLESKGFQFFNKFPFYKSCIYSHESKLKHVSVLNSFFTSLVVLLQTRDRHEENLDLHLNILEKFQDFDFMKQRGFYVGFINRGISEPRSINKENADSVRSELYICIAYAKMLFEYAEGDDESSNPYYERIYDYLTSENILKFVNTNPE